MRTYDIEFKKSAVKELRKLPKNEATRVSKLIKALAHEPRPMGCKKLKGYDDLWRVRSGDYRVIYSIEDEVLVIEILDIVNRKDAY